MENISQILLWETLLDLRKIAASQPNPTQCYSIVFRKGICKAHTGIVSGLKDEKSVIISREHTLSLSPDSVYFTLDNENNISQIGESFLDITSNNFLKLYLPFCFSEYIAHKLKRTFTVLHLAQTLDGRIATETGHSKWISSEENLVHAHRMRALCDATLIGGNTLKYDSPKLNVRLVNGPDPIRVIIANTHCNFENLKKIPGEILLFTSKDIVPVEGVEIITIPKISDYIFSNLILEELYKRDIFSLYIEGGAITASQFVKEKTVDKVQIYISPKIFGSGINSFSLPPIENVENSISFSNSSFKTMGNGMLFEGVLSLKNVTDP